MRLRREARVKQTVINAWHGEAHIKATLRRLHRRVKRESRHATLQWFMSVWAAAAVRRKRRRRAAGLLLRSLRGAVMRRVMVAWEDHTEEAARREKRCVRLWLWRWLWRWLCVMVCADGAPALLCCSLSEAIHNWQLGALRMCWDVLSTNVRLSREAKLRLGKADDHFRRLRLSQAVQCLSLHARRRRATREVGVALRACGVVPAGWPFTHAACLLWVRCVRGLCWVLGVWCNSVMRERMAGTTCRNYTRRCVFGSGSFAAAVNSV